MDLSLQLYVVQADMGIYIILYLATFVCVYSQQDFVAAQYLGSKLPPLPEVDYVGCFSQDYAVSKPHNKLRFTHVWEGAVRGCDHRLTTHMAVQWEGFIVTNHVYCDNDLARLSTPVNSSFCVECFSGPEYTKCGMEDNSSVAVYKLRERIPLAVMIAVEDVGVIMVRNDTSKMSLLLRHNTTPTTLGYSYEDDEIILANQTTFNRFFFNFDKNEYQVYTGDVPTCNGSVLRAPAVDWVNKEVIYGCDKNRKLQVIDFVGDLYAKDILTHNHYFNDIAYDPYQKQVFFTNLGDKVFRHELAPKLTTDLTKKGVLTKGRTVSVDTHYQKLFVVGETATTPRGQATLVRMNYDGSSPQVVYQGPELVGNPAKLDVYDKTVVWVSNNSTEQRSIAYKCDLNANYICEKDKLKRILVSIKYLSDLKIYHPLKQAPESELNTRQPSSGSNSGTKKEVEVKYGAACPPVEGNKVVCKINNEVLPCEENWVPPGTKATQRCKDLRNQLYLPESATLTCQDSGDWDHHRFYCTAECGVPSNNITVTQNIINGEEVQPGEYPWQAGLYMRKMPNGTTSDTWQQLCGATLISPRLVITAAHCLVYGEGRLQQEDVKVGLGKIFRDFYKNEPFSVIADVREVVIPRLYLGPKSNYAQDIALLHLTEKIHFNDYIRPACVDWEQALNFATWERVHVAGWGFTEQNAPSEVLLFTKLDYLDLYTCLQKLTGSSQKQVHITYDKFCAQSVNGSQVWQGDSGGGMTAVKNKQHFIIGIVSARLSTELDYSMFTNIYGSDHFSWLEREQIRLKTA